MWVCRSPLLLTRHWFILIISCLLGVIAHCKSLPLISRVIMPLDRDQMWLSAQDLVEWTVKIIIRESPSFSVRETLARSGAPFPHCPSSWMLRKKDMLSLWMTTSLPVLSEVLLDKTLCVLHVLLHTYSGSFYTDVTHAGISVASSRYIWSIGLLLAHNIVLCKNNHLTNKVSLCVWRILVPCH